MRVRPPPNCALNARGIPNLAASNPIREHHPSSTGTIIAVTGVLLTMALRGPTRRHKRTMPAKCDPGVPRTMLTRISNQPVAAMAFAIGKRNATLVTVVSDNPARTDEGLMMSARAKTQAPPMSTTSDGKVGRSNVISKIMKMVFASTKATFQNGTTSPPSPLVNVWADRRPIAKQANARVTMQPMTSARHKSRRASCAVVLGFSSGASDEADALLGALFGGAEAENTPATAAVFGSGMPSSEKRFVCIIILFVDAPRLVCQASSQAGVCADSTEMLAKVSCGPPSGEAGHGDEGTPSVVSGVPDGHATWSSGASSNNSENSWCSCRLVFG
mmetsp:Transcript_111683/g.355303  ORF Transcript_111683/g.355303 Transcript_111683/m.355303 type:complete len:331 (+) Transcript_111683:500-1492(+)